jgi:hypothetical protein
LAGINPFSELLGGFMSIFSAIDAERGLNIVEKAIAKEKENLQYDPEPYDRIDVVQILDRILKYCRENITE